MTLQRGDKLGAYEIIAPLGEGGMGQVYRARDTKLGREVALKLLPDDVAADPDRRARFEREARALAALNHPNIVGIYAIEMDGTRPFLAMEYVQGDVLSEVIRKGGVPLERLLTIATQIAAAVATAHKHGVVHRDLKPANVVVAGDRVKVLDFGLAKLREDAGGAAETLPTAQVITGEGKILGTVAYMSPEQAEGRAVDQRSDIFSIGVLLYEMATGERPFKGDSSISVLSAILRDTPKPLSEINPRLPRELARIVRRCLAKDRDERFQSASDLKNDLEDVRQSVLSGELSRAEAPLPAPSRAPGWTAAGLVFGAAALTALAALGWPRAGSAALPLRAMQFSRLTLLAGVANEPSISPDGKWVAYVSSGDIYLQSTTGETAINLTKDSPAVDRMPAFSPDGELIAFRSDREGGGLFVMGRTGDSVRRISRTGFYPSWFPDGKRVTFSTVFVGVPESRGGGVSEIWSVDINSGQPQLIFRGDAMQPRVSPNGRRIAYWAMPMDEELRTFVSANRDLWTIGVDGTGAVRFTTEESTEANAVWSPSGDALYFLSDRAGSMNLWRKGIDEHTGAPIGDAQPLTAPESYVRDFSLSADGRLGTYANFATTGNLARVRFDARTASPVGTVEPLTSGSRDFIALDVNRDNEVVLMKAFTQQEDLLVVSANAGLRHLVKDRFRDRNPRWSPDGQKVYFYSDRGRHYEVYSIDRDGGGLRRLTDTGGNRFYPVPSPDGSKLASSNIRTFELYIYDTADFSKPPEALPKLPESMRGGTFVVIEWSPDGRSIMGVSGQNIWVYSLNSQSYQVVGRSAGGVQWLPDGKRLVISRQGRLYLRDLELDSEREIMSLPGENIGAIDFSPDRTYLYFARGNQTGDIWLVRFGEATPTETTAGR